MDTLSIIITLVSVIAGVLQIVLFFKVWGMCDDIRALRKSATPVTENAVSEEDNADNSLSWLIAIAVVTVLLVLIFALS